MMQVIVFMYEFNIPIDTILKRENEVYEYIEKNKSKGDINGNK